MNFMTRCLGATAVISALACAGQQAAPKGAAEDEIELLTFDAAIVSESLAAMALKAPWQLQNASAGPVVVRKVRWQLAVDGREPLTGEWGTPVTAPAGGNAASDLMVVATFSPEPPPTTPEAASARVRDYTLSGTFELETASGPQSYEGEWTGRLFLPVKPTLQVRPQAGRFDGMLELNIAVSVYNQNGFPVRLEALEARILLSGAEIYNSVLGTGAHIAPNSEVAYDVNRWIGRDDLKDLAKKLEKVKQVPYEVEAALRVDGAEMRESVRGDITFPR